MSPRRRDTGWRLFVRSACARAYPRVIMNARERQWVFFDVALPLVGLSAYVFVYRTAHAPNDLIGFVILGGAMGSYWLSVMWSMANQFYWEKEMGNMALYIIAPNSLASVLAGMALGGIFAASLRAMSILLVGTLLFHIQYSISSAPLLAAAFTLALLALYGMGMMFASLFLLFGREAWHMVNLMQEPIFLLSGTYFPIRGFNTWVAGAATLIPLTLAVDAMRQLLFHSEAARGLLAVRTELWGLAALAAAFLALARLSLEYMERLAIRDGRITESRT
jgi:ABC-2 type transport system permease protein